MTRKLNLKLLATCLLAPLVVAVAATAASSPSVATGSTTKIGNYSVTLTGTVNPNGEATSWTFQYGLTNAYGVQTFGGSLPAGSSPQTVTKTLQGLEPGTTFHYRLVALHGQTVVSDGQD